MLLTEHCTANADLHVTMVKKLMRFHGNCANDWSWKQHYLFLLCPVTAGCFVQAHIQYAFLVMKHYPRTSHNNRHFN